MTRAHAWGAAATLAAVVGCHSERPYEKPITPVGVAVATEARPDTVSRYSATVDAVLKVDLAFRVGGYVRSLGTVAEGSGRRLLREGDRVRRGMALATIDQTDNSERAQQVRAQLAEATAASAQADRIAGPRARAVRQGRACETGTRSRPDRRRGREGPRRGRRRRRASGRVGARRSHARGALRRHPVEEGRERRGAGAAWGSGVQPRRHQFGQGRVRRPRRRPRCRCAPRRSTCRPTRTRASRSRRASRTSRQPPTRAVGSSTSSSPSPTPTIVCVRAWSPPWNCAAAATRRPTCWCRSRPSRGHRAAPRATPSSSSKAQGAATVVRQRVVDLGELRGNLVTVSKGLRKGDRVVVSGTSFVTDGATVRVVL